MSEASSKSTGRRVRDAAWKGGACLCTEKEKRVGRQQVGGKGTGPVEGGGGAIFPGGLVLGEPPISKTVGAEVGVGVERAGKAQSSAGVWGVCQLFLGPKR